MPTILFFFDFYSPLTYTAFQQIPHQLANMAWHMLYCPVVWSASSIEQEQAHFKTLSAQNDAPALVWPEASITDSTQWAHLAISASPSGYPSRYICESLLKAIWQTGSNPNSPTFQQETLEASTSLLPDAPRFAAAQTNQQLEAFQQYAQAHGLSNSGFIVCSEPLGSTQQAPTHSISLYTPQHLALLRQKIMQLRSI